MAHQVTAALAVVRDVGGRTHYLYRGGLVPPGLAADDELERLVALGLLAEIPDPPVELDDHGLDDGITPGSPATAPVPVRPKNVANRDAWQVYVLTTAEHYGDESMTLERAEGMTKDELIAWKPAS